MTERQVPQGDSEAASELHRLAGRLKHPSPEHLGGITPPGGESAAFDILMSESYKGGFAHPDVLKALNECVTDGAERAFSLAEREQAHRHEVDTKLIDAQVSLIGSEVRRNDADIVDRRVAIVLTFLLLAGVIVAAFVTGINGHVATASIIGVSATALTGILAVVFRNKSASSSSPTN